MQDRDGGGLAVPVAGLDSVGGFRALVELSPDAVFVIRDGYHVFANARGLALLGARTISDLQVQPASAFMHPDCRREAIARMHTMVDDRAALDYVEEKIVRLDGGVLDIEAAGTPIEVGGRTAALVVIRDITARKRVEAALQLAEGRFQAAFWYAPTAIAILDRAGRVTAANPTLGRLAGTGADDLAGRPFWELADAPDRPAVGAMVGSLTAGTLSGVRGDFRFRLSDGSIGWMHGCAARLPGESTYFIVHLLDVTARKQEQQDLAERALHDPLTGLVNRTGVLDALTTALRGPDAEVAVLFADLDGFKTINDRHGHPVGDQVLVAVARRMRAAVPDSDPVGRIGGDEFAIVLSGREAAGRACQIADRLHDAVSRPISVASMLVRVGVSIGIATARAGQQVTAASLLASADTAMYQAKSVSHSGGGRSREGLCDDLAGLVGRHPSRLAAGP
jgi:diguanylate cyclase (GGDEF)-like protein/PAS domain S-box-containing protein